MTYPAPLLPDLLVGWQKVADRYNMPIYVFQTGDTYHAVSNETQGVGHLVDTLAPHGSPSSVSALLKVISITSTVDRIASGQFRTPAHSSRGGHQRRHAAHAIKSDDRNRSAAEDTGLVGCIGQNMAFLQ